MMVYLVIFKAEPQDSFFMKDLEDMACWEYGDFGGILSSMRTLFDFDLKETEVLVSQSV